MSMRVDHVSFGQNGLALYDTPNATFRGFPRVYPLTFIWSCYPDSFPSGQYGTCFVFGEEPSFSGVDYQTAAIVISGGKSYWSVGADGTDTLGDEVVSGSWFRQAYRSRRTASATEHQFFYNLPDLSKNVENNAGSTYMAQTSVSTSFHLKWADTDWSTNESFKGLFASIKMYQAYMSTAEILAESRSPYPVLPKYANVLWDILPLKTLEDRNISRIKTINNRRWGWRDDAPLSDGQQPNDWVRSTWWNPAFNFSPASLGPVISDVNTTETWNDGDTDIVVTGTGFI